LVEVAVRHNYIRVIIELSFFYRDYHSRGRLPSRSGPAVASQTVTSA
jgi:hypothetical protein